MMRRILNLPKANAKRILLRRFLAAYGPATARDFSHWSGISMKEAAPVWESLADGLKEVTIEDQRASIHREDYEALVEANIRRMPLRLIKGFDPFLLAHAGKDHLVERKHYKRVYRNQGWITRAVLQNGRVIGNWSATRRGTAPALEIELFEKASKAAKEKIKKEASSLGTLLREAFLIKLH